MKAYQLLIALVWLLTFVGRAPAQTVPEPSPAGVALRAGDAIRIEVWRQPTLSGEFDIAANGTIKHPLYREVNVAGTNVMEVRARLQAFLSRLESNPQFEVIPLVRVAVGGEVRQPNLLKLPMETTIGQALALAGGTTERGDIRKVRVIRGGSTMAVDLGDASGAAWSPVQSGDQILVGRRSSVFRDYIAPGASILSAIALVITAIQ